MQSKMTTLLLASALAISTTAVLAGSLNHKNRDAARFDDRAGAYEYRPDWYRVWQLNRLYRQREGYLPDYRGCFPGVCRDNPYY
jgi:hypothetical protein